MAPKKAKAKSTRKVKDLQPRKGAAAKVRGGRTLPDPLRVKKIHPYE